MSRDDVVALLVAERFAPAPPARENLEPADRAAAEAEAHRAELLAALR